MYLYMTVIIMGISEAFPLNCLAVAFRVPAEKGTEDLGQHSTPETRPCTPHPGQPHLCHPGATGDAVMVQHIALPHVKSHLLWLPKSLLPSHLNPSAPRGGVSTLPPRHTAPQNPICVRPIGAAPPVPPPFSMLGSGLPGGGKRLGPLGGGHKAAPSTDPAAERLRPWER